MLLTCMLLLIAFALPKSAPAIPLDPGSIELGAFRRGGISGEMDGQFRRRRQRQKENALLLMFG